MEEVREYKKLLSEKGKKYVLGSFDSRKTIKLIKKYPWLRAKYNLLLKRYKKHLNYHYNEFILSFIYLFTIKKDRKLEIEYTNIKVTNDDPTRFSKEELGEVQIEETTSAGSSGAYSTPIFKKPIRRESSNVKESKNINMKKLKECDCEKTDMGNMEKPKKRLLYDDEKMMESGTGFDDDIYDEEEDLSKTKFSEYYKKTVKEEKMSSSMTNAKRIGKDNKKNFGEYLKNDLGKKTATPTFDKDSLNKKDYVKKNNTKEEDDILMMGRGVGLEGFVSDQKESKETEDRFKKQMKSPNTDLDKHKNRMAWLDKKEEASKNAMYKKTPTPIKKANESKTVEPKEKIDEVAAKFQRLINYSPLRFNKNKNQL